MAVPSSDRYVSFANIDFDGNMRAVMHHLSRYMDDPAKTTPYGNASSSA